MQHHTHYEYANRSHDHDDTYEKKDTTGGCFLIFVVPLALCSFAFVVGGLELLGDKTGWWDWKFNEWMTWLTTCGGTYCNN